ncbi:pyrimidine reductase family protein [Solihabitans fulvus]|uniref:Pyrimidine reductase family protein n=1 Tax=Solihabitans fulvus TaxID=1892852 RepID=A0A5B2XEF2_9PSEU|nr:pyrimidine reductase family protein [Solihabitans fulvus]KAA2261152.1 pyrimidine reductase family protein [Solihabitans fulvus]
MHRLWPQDLNETTDTSLGDAELERAYDYPADLDRPWVQVNFVSSADGAVTVGGRSQGLSSPADKKVFALGRDLADVVLVGAGTAQLEGYRGVKANEVRAERRARLGLAPVPPIAVVTARATVSPDSPLLTDTLVPPIILTCAAAPRQRRDELAEAGAEVVVVGDEAVDLRAALAELNRRGLRRVNCEGGPTLFGGLIAEDLVDELCLTVAPLLAGGDAGRIATGPLPPAARELVLASVLHAEGSLLLRYRRAAR